MGRGSPTARISRALDLELYGATAYNSGHPYWARYYFDRAVRRVPEQGGIIGDFYRHKAEFDQEMIQQRTYSCDSDRKADLDALFESHWRAKHYYKRALCKQQHFGPLLLLLSGEYQQLAWLADRPNKAAHFQERADYYAQAAQGMEKDATAMQQYAVDAALLRMAPS